MARIIEYVEEKALGTLSESADNRTSSTARAITRAATEVAEEVDARVHHLPSPKRPDPRLVARHRSRIPITLLHTHRARAQLPGAGGDPLDGKKVHHTDELVEDVDLRISQMSLVAPGDKTDRGCSAGRARHHQRDARPPGGFWFQPDALKEPRLLSRSRVDQRPPSAARLLAPVRQKQQRRNSRHLRDRDRWAERNQSSFCRASALSTPQATSWSARTPAVRRNDREGP